MACIRKENDPELFAQQRHSVDHIDTLYRLPPSLLIWVTEHNNKVCFFFFFKPIHHSSLLALHKQLVANSITDILLELFFFFFKSPLTVMNKEGK